ncbi:Type 2 glycosyltransferase [Pseudocercospora fuligena]|uniref:Type 2 glycosyltransferase n=1 Tax=Pseudocercospora fuligena TaxID=685502 RepID=A0A8H6VNP1_9PEZI|nr:Type 2 glycosyltransferase [Pseudocercospora fuligena]
MVSSLADSGLGLYALAIRAYHHPQFWFWTVFVFRYLRTVVHLISFWCYRPAPVLNKPRYKPEDCSVILPTVDPENPEFTECIESCLRNKPLEIIIVTVGDKNEKTCRAVVDKYFSKYPTVITVHICPIANKRHQVATAIPKAIGEITILLDDHVIWPANFLKTAIAPFEDGRVGAVGTNKRVRRTDTGFNIRSYWNMLGAIYLERHNFEIRATNTIDGGVFVISGRTSLHRTQILQEQEFLDGFTDERFFFGLCGPLNPDDDNYITRYEVKKCWDIKIQYCEDACIETTLGTYPKFVSQCLRWVRTTWRSNSCSLFTDRTVWYRQPWCVYAVYISSFFNFALFNDFGLAYLLHRSGYGTTATYWSFGLWIFTTKMVKLTPYFFRHPEDLRMLPGYFAFAYFHSLVKLYALFTFWNCHWGGRNLAAINKSANGVETEDIDEIDPADLPPYTDHNGRTICKHCGGSYVSVFRGMLQEILELFYDVDTGYLTWFGLTVAGLLIYLGLETVIEDYGFARHAYYPFVAPTLICRRFGGC